MEGHGHGHHLCSQGLEPAELPSQSLRLGPLGKDRGPSRFPQQQRECVAWADICVGKQASRTAAGSEAAPPLLPVEGAGRETVAETPSPYRHSRPIGTEPWAPHPGGGRTRLANTPHSTRE